MYDDTNNDGVLFEELSATGSSAILSTSIYADECVKPQHKHYEPINWVRIIVVISIFLLLVILGAVLTPMVFKKQKTNSSNDSKIKDNVDEVNKVEINKNK